MNQTEFDAECIKLHREYAEACCDLNLERMRDQYETGARLAKFERGKAEVRRKYHEALLAVRAEHSERSPEMYRAKFDQSLIRDEALGSIEDEIQNIKADYLEREINRKLRKSQITQAYDKKREAAVREYNEWQKSRR